MTSTNDAEDIRKKLIPRSPRLRARNPASIPASSGAPVNSPPRETSSESTATVTTSVLTPASTPNNASRSPTPQGGDRQHTLERGVANLSLWSASPDFDFARSKSVPVFGSQEPQVPARNAGRATRGQFFDPADFPLPSIEVKDSVTDQSETTSSPLKEGLLSEKSSPHQSDDEPSKLSSPARVIEDRQPSIAGALANLSLLSPSPEESRVDQRLSSLGAELAKVQPPVTVRDLPNATPRPSPSPRAQSQSPGPNSNASIIYDSSAQTNEATPDGFVVEQDGPMSETENGTADEESDYGEEPDELFEYYYDVSTEEQLPPSPYASQSFQEVLRSGLALSRNICSSLSDIPLATESDTQLFRMHQTARRLQEFTSPAKRRIGIVGDSGVGKSSLINSLLHEPELAHRGDTGHAVTSFVTEYRKRKANQTTPFLIKVQCSQKEHIEEQIDDLLFQFRKPYEPGFRERLQETSDESREMDRKSKLAYSTLHSLLGRYGQITEAFLKGSLDDSFVETDDSSGTIEDIKRCLHVFAENIQWPQGTEGGEWEETAATARDCRKVVAQFMENGFWPLIDRVKVYLSSQILKTGIILVDLPGFRDINLARVKKTERYQHKCHEIFIVASIKRACSDESVKQMISERRLGSTKAGSGVTVVCTHADDIDIELSESNQEYAPFVNERERRAARRAQKQALKTKQADTIEEKDLVYQGLFIRARNRLVRDQIVKKYKDLTGGRPLKVFCVSNKHYQGQAINFRDGRRFAIKHSGIPDLRKFCHSVVARAQFRASCHYLETEIPDLVQSLKLWVDAAERDGQTPVLPPDLLSGLEGRLRDVVDDLRDDIEDDFKTQILDFWHVHQRAFEDCAIDTSDGWRSLAWNSYKAFCRNDGTHSTPAVSYRCWNLELLSRMTANMEAPWESVEDDLCELLDALDGDLRDHISNFLEEMQDYQVSCTLLSSMRAKQRQLNYCFEEEQTKLLEHLHNVQSDTTENHYNSYIFTDMEPVYRACALDSGPGTQARMHRIMANKMHRRDIFSGMSKQIKKRILGDGGAYDKFTDNVTNHVIGMCSDINEQLRMIQDAGPEASKLPPRDLRRVTRLANDALETIKTLQERAEPAKREATKVGWIEHD